VIETRPHTHRRRNPLTGDWVLVSPGRSGRPWKGAVEPTREPRREAYDPDCYLCPGNQRAGGELNPAYTGTFAFDNDFPALSPDADDSPDRAQPLFRSQAETGKCRVVCFSPRHDVSLAEMSTGEIAGVVQTWAGETRRLMAEPGIGYVQVFENKGEAMGCSNPHPHSQIWALRHVPDEVAKELRHQKSYAARHGSRLLADYVARERESAERLVLSNQHFTALVPYWAVWPFETMVLPHRSVGALTDLDPGEIRALADLLGRLMVRYDNLFQCSFPYSMGFHQAPASRGGRATAQLHAHVYPPLLRSASVRKFMVGFEMLCMPQRDLSPEEAADRLRQQSETHYERNA